MTRFLSHFVDGLLLTDVPEVDAFFEFCMCFAAFVIGLVHPRTKAERVADKMTVVNEVLEAYTVPRKRRTVRKLRTYRVVPEIDDSELVVSVNSIMFLCVDFDNL